MTPGVALRLGRVSNLPTAWSNVLCGMWLAGADPRAPGQGMTLGLLLLSTSLAYVGGMYLNDAFDRHIDARQRPGRPIPSGAVAASTVFALGFGMLGASVGLVLWHAAQQAQWSWGGPGAAAALAAVIVGYDVFHKQNPLSPLLMGLCRVLVYVTAGLVAAGALPAALWWGAAALLGHLIGLTFAAKQEHLASFRGGWPLLLLAMPVGLGLWLAVGGAPINPVTGGLTLLLAAWSTRCVRLLRPGTRNVPGAITGLIAGISLVDAVLVGAGAPVLAVACVAAFGLTLVLQRWVPGT